MMNSKRIKQLILVCFLFALFVTTYASKKHNDAVLYVLSNQFHESGLVDDEVDCWNEESTHFRFFSQVIICEDCDWHNNRIGEGEADDKCKGDGGD